MKRLALVALLALTLSGCSPISSGIITGKRYEPEREYWMQQCASYNSKGICTVYIPVRHVSPESWEFTLVERRNGDYSGDRKTGWVEVTRETYDAYNVGDYYGSEQ